MLHNRISDDFLASRFDPVSFTSKAFEPKAAVVIRTCAGRHELNDESIGRGAPRAEEMHINVGSRRAIPPYDLAFNRANEVFIRKTKL